MPRHKREIGNTGWAHIIIRGINHENLFYDSSDYERFIRGLERVRKETGFSLAAYCLMSNHVHFLIYDGNGAYAEIYKKLLVSYAYYYNKKYDRTGHVFQDRFRSEAVDDERYLLAVTRYIYKNPEKAGICLAKDYPYTFIQYEGLFSDYFESESKMMEYMETDSDDRCLDYDSVSGYREDEAIRKICDMISDENPQHLQQYSLRERNEILRQMKQTGLSIRQISRITGINRNIIQRV